MPVAIKEFFPTQFASRMSDSTIQPTSDSDREAFQWGLKRFILEGQTLAGFKHQSIIQVLSFFEANQTAYLVMPYEEGQSLDIILKKRKKLSEQILLDLIEHLLGALETLHKANIIHRDLKPGNIYIRNDNTPVLLDFGSARQVMREQNRALTTLFTPGYAPIEQYYSDSNSQGPWTDIYSMAAVLYRIVTGKTPTQATDRSGALLKQLPDPLAPATLLANGRYSQPFLQAIDNALMVLEKDRPQNVADWRLHFQPCDSLLSHPQKTEKQHQKPSRPQPEKSLTQPSESTSSNSTTMVPRRPITQSTPKTAPSRPKAPTQTSSKVEHKQRETTLYKLGETSKPDVSKGFFGSIGSLFGGQKKASVTPSKRKPSTVRSVTQSTSYPTTDEGNISHGVTIAQILNHALQEKMIMRVLFTTKRPNYLTRLLLPTNENHTTLNTITEKHPLRIAPLKPKRGNHKIPSASFFFIYFEIDDRIFAFKTHFKNKISHSQNLSFNLVFPTTLYRFPQRRAYPRIVAPNHSLMDLKLVRMSGFTYHVKVFDISMGGVLCMLRPGESTLEGVGKVMGVFQWPPNRKSEIPCQILSIKNMEEMTFCQIQFMLQGDNSKKRDIETLMNVISSETRNTTT